MGSVYGWVDGMGPQAGGEWQSQGSGSWGSDSTGPWPWGELQSAHVGETGAHHRDMRGKDHGFVPAHAVTTPHSQPYVPTLLPDATP